MGEKEEAEKRAREKQGPLDAGKRAEEQHNDKPATINRCGDYSMPVAVTTINLCGGYGGHRFHAGRQADEDQRKQLEIQRNARAEADKRAGEYQCRCEQKYGSRPHWNGCRFQSDGWCRIHYGCQQKPAGSIRPLSGGWLRRRLHGKSKTNCPCGEAMNEWCFNPNGRFKCDVCDEDVERKAGDMMLGCRKCNWDACPECIAKEGLTCKTRRRLKKKGVRCECCGRKPAKKYVGENGSVCWYCSEACYEEMTYYN